MKVSLKWLNQYVDLHDLSAEEIADKLTFAGIEVEEYYPLAKATNLVIGEIKSCEKHPDSDHLHILQVDEGTFGVKQIVCGAPNAREGLKVIVAQPEAKLGAITIKKSTIRGVDSFGMCCSLAELGVDHKYLSEAQINGIEELPLDAEIGNTNVLEYLGLDDVIFDLKLLANRSDCLAILNVAKELAALFERKYHGEDAPKFKEQKSNFIVNSTTNLCPQFAIKEIHNIKVSESPLWMQRRLMACGIRSINNIVDIGNYIMLLTGQPLHMYDMDKLKSHNLCVRDDVEKKFVALDDKEYQLQKGDIVIMNEDNVACLGGVMGSKMCAVDFNTKNIAIEAANFDSKTVRHTSTRLNLSSDSSQRFVKGINKDQYAFVLDLTAKFVSELCETKDIYETVVYDTLNHDTTVIETSCSYINRRLGSNFEHDLIRHTLERVGIEINDINGDDFKATVPAHRIDIRLNADLSEEVIRLLGFDNVISTLPELKTTVGSLKTNQLHTRQIRDFLVDNGFYETLNYTLVSEKLNKYFMTLNNYETYTLLHPMTEDHKIVRRNLLPSLLDTLSYNLARQGKNIKLFEVSNVYTKNGAEEHLGIVMCGEDEYRHLMQKVPYEFAHIKGIFEAIMHMLGVENHRYKMNRISDVKEFHSGRSVEIILNNTRIAVFGEAHPSIIKDFDLGKNKVMMLELNLSALEEVRVPATKAVAPSKYQMVERDLALVVKKDVPASDIISLIRRHGHNLIRSVDVFDAYEGEHIVLGYKSLALKIVYENMNKSFTSEEISNIEQEIISDLEAKLDVKLRS